MDLSPEDYCREIETYLCKKNGGHLIRIVGPAFEQVCAWATRGVPLKVAQHGIDRLVERTAAKGPRRRPVRIEFCEADVLDVFDEWRRAVGVPAAIEPVTPGGRASDDSAEASRRHGSLPAHLERVIARLTAMRGSAAFAETSASKEDRRLDDVLDGIVRELDAARAASRSLRGEARERFLERLQLLDASLLAAARERCDEVTLRELDADAAAQLAPFRDRLPPDAYEKSRIACIDRGVRERLRLPVIAYDS